MSDLIMAAVFGGMAGSSTSDILTNPAAIFTKKDTLIADIASANISWSSISNAGSVLGLVSTAYGLYTLNARGLTFLGSAVGHLIGGSLGGIIGGAVTSVALSVIQENQNKPMKKQSKKKFNIGSSR